MVDDRTGQSVVPRLRAISFGYFVTLPVMSVIFRSVIRQILTLEMYRYVACSQVMDSMETPQPICPFGASALSESGN